jgi:hypothetical protein
MSEFPRLALGVATDVKTVRDFTDEELTFRTAPGETIEIAQIARGAEPVSLLRLPESSTVRVPLTPAGAHLAIADGVVRVAAVVHFAPSARADELTGVVAVSWPPALDQLMDLLEPLGGGARLETPGGTLVLGTPIPAGVDTLAVPLTSEAAQGAKLVAPAPRPGGLDTGRLALAGGVALLGLLGSALLWRAGRRAPAPESSVAPAPAEKPAAVAGGEQRIGRYTVLSRLGSGGMADVYLARAEGEAGFGRKVALKVMREELASDDKFVSHFLDEARLASRLDHPNIVAITDLGKQGDRYVIAMELIDGSDLERLLHGMVARGEQMPIDVALAITRRICDGLHFAHSAVDEAGESLHLVHRDVKAANIFVSRTGSVKVGDFGIAKIRGTMRSARTEYGEVKGTAAYMAPEHRLGQDVDRRADLYAVGAICYELLTGQVINLDLAMIAHLGKEGWPHLPRPSSVRPELPAELDDIVFQAMAFERDARQASCDQLEHELAAVVERHRLGISDKAVAQWVTGRITQSDAAAADTAV